MVCRALSFQSLENLQSVIIRQKIRIALTNARVIDEYAWVAMSLTNRSAEVDKIRKVGNIALIVVYVWHCGRTEMSVTWVYVFEWNRLTFCKLGRQVAYVKHNHTSF